MNRFSKLVAACLSASLSGCGGSHGFSSSPPFDAGPSSYILPRQSTQRSTSGGQFKATYSGRARTSCYADIDCSFALKGTGSGTASSLRSVYDGSCEESISWSDGLTITSTSGSGDSIDVVVSGVPTVCKHSERLRGSYMITGGTGSFTSAGGRGSVTIHLERRTFAAHFTGTLTF